MVNVCRLVLRAPKQNAYLTPIDENEALGLMAHVGTQTSSDDAVPRWQEHGVELIFNYLRNVVKYSALLEGKCDAVHGLLLHVLVHVGELDNRVLGVLLVDASMGLHQLSVLLSLPFLSLLHSGIGGCSLCCHTFKFINLILNRNVQA